MACLIDNSASAHFSKNCASPNFVFWLRTPGLFGGVYMMALARAKMTVFSAAPVFSVFCRKRIMYFASSFDPSYKSLTMMDSFAIELSLPLVFAILLNSVKT